MQTENHNVIDSSAQKALIQALNWRYAVKRYDVNKKLDDETLNTLIEAMRLTPSSLGIQPWKFIIVSNRDVQARLKEAGFNQAQLIAVIIDRKLVAVAQMVNVGAQNADTGRMKSTHPQIPPTVGKDGLAVAYQIVDSVAHFGRRFIRKSNRKNSGGIDPVVEDQVGDSVGQHPSLSGTSTRENQNGPIGRSNGKTLLFI